MTKSRLIILCLWIVNLGNVWLSCNCSRLLRGEVGEERMLLVTPPKKKEHNPFAAPLPKAAPGSTLNGEEATLFPPSSRLKYEMDMLEKGIAFGLFSPLATEQILNVVSLW
jgi:hypothetical protein